MTILSFCSSLGCTWLVLECSEVDLTTFPWLLFNVYASQMVRAWFSISLTWTWPFDILRMYVLVSRCFNEVHLRILACLRPLSMYVLASQSFLKIDLTILLVCAPSDGTCLVLHFLWSRLDHFPHFHFLRMYVLISCDVSMKLIWQIGKFVLVCTSMCLVLHFREVDLIILPICAFLVCTCSTPCSLQADLTFLPVCTSSECMCLFLNASDVDLTDFVLSAHPQHVRA